MFVLSYSKTLCSALRFAPFATSPANPKLCPYCPLHIGELHQFYIASGGTVEATSQDIGQIPVWPLQNFDIGISGRRIAQESIYML
jgi:hypothetical protein